MCLPCVDANYIKSGLGNVLHVSSIFFVLVISYLVFGLIVSVHGRCSKTGDKWAASRAPIIFAYTKTNKRFCSSAVFGALHRYNSPSTFYIRHFNLPAIFYGCTARFVSDLIWNTEDSLSLDTAQIILYEQECKKVDIIKKRVVVYFGGIKNLLNGKNHIEPPSVIFIKLLLFKLFESNLNYFIKKPAF